MFILAFGNYPSSSLSVLGLPIILAAAGAAIWIFGRISELKSAAKPWKWLGIVPAALGFFIGLGECLKMRDFLYRDLIEPLGKKMAVAHYAAAIVPLAFVVGVAAWEVFDRVRAREE